MSEEQLIQGMSDSGKAPSVRIKNAKAAYELFDRVKRDDDLTAFYRAQIQGLIDGNPPYSAEKLQRSGQSWRSNVNFREGEAIIETNASSIWELDMEVAQLITARVEIDDPNTQALNYAGIIEEEYTRALADWPDYFFNRMLCTKEMLTHGIGAMFWADKWCWKPKAVKRAALLIPSKSKATPGELELVGFRHSYQAHELYQLISSEEKKAAAEKEGWNLTLIKEALIKSSRNQSSSDEQQLQTTALEAVQQGLKNNDIAYSSVYCEPIRVIHGLIREYSGKITHVIIYEDDQFADYLYLGKEEFDSMEQAVCLFLWNIGDGYYKSVKGLGHRIYPHIELSNRQINGTVDGSFLASSLIMSAQGTNKEPNLMRLGPVTIVPDGFQPIQSTFAPNLGQLISVRYMLQQILNNNTGVYKKAVEAPDMPERTAREVTIEEMRSAKLEKNQMSVYYLYLDALHKEIFRRLTAKEYPTTSEGFKEAKTFRERCAKRGVPSELLNPEKCQVKAARAIGYGSAAMRDHVTREVLGLSPGMDEIGRNNALRDRLAALVGYNMVDRYLAMVKRDQIPTDVHSLATLENNDILTGQKVLVGVDQPHVIHWQIHFPLLANIAQAFMQTPQAVNVIASVTAMQTGLQHLAEHLAALQRDPSRKAQVKALEGQLEQLATVFKKMQATAQKIQEAQAKQAQANAEMLARAQQQEMDKKWMIEREKMMREMELKVQKTIAGIQTATVKAQAGIERENAKAQAEISREDAKAAAAV